MSIAFSTAATVLIMAGWAKRRKLEDEVELPEPEIEAASELDELGEMTQEVAATPATEPAPEPEETAELPALKKKAAPTASRSGRAKVVVIPGRGRYHTPACRFAKNPAAERVTAATARKRGLEPCSVCQPG